MATDINEQEPIFSIPAILFVIPAYLYLCNYEYEKGFCDYYRIPKELITPDITTNLAHCLSFFFFFYGFYVLPHFINYFLSHELPRSIAAQFSEKVPFPIIRLCIWTAQFFGVFTILMPYKVDIIKTVLMVVAIVITEYLLYSFAKIKLSDKTFDRWWNLFKLSSDYIPPIDIINIRGTLINDMKNNNLIIFIIVIITAFYNYCYGVGDAYRKTIYDVDVNKKEWVFLKKYGDNLIFKNYNQTTCELGDSLSIVKIDSNNSKFTTQKINHLHYKKEFDILGTFFRLGPP